MKLLVTGAAGDFGRDLVPLLARSHDVRATDIAPVQVPCEFVQADLLEEEALGSLVQGREAVVHLAAMLPPRRPTTRECFDVNTTATGLLMEAAAGAGVSHFVYVSTIWATGHGVEEPMRPIDETAPWNPICAYGFTKLLGELAGDYCRRTTGMRVTVLRHCGYQRCSELGADGALDWERVDWPTLLSCLTLPGQKLFDPIDLLAVFESALRLEEDFGRYIVGQQWPFEADDAEPLSDDPASAWARHYPDAQRLFEAVEFEPPKLHAFYSTDRFSEATGWRQRLTIEAVARRHFEAHGDEA